MTLYSVALVALSAGAAGAELVALPYAQYASEVIAHSSQYSNTVWSAAQALGPPDTNDYGDCDTAWAPDTNESPWDEAAYVASLQFLGLGYATPVHATGVTIRETLGNGFVRRVDVQDLEGVWHQAWKGPDSSQPGTPVNFTGSWTRTPYLVKGSRSAATSTRRSASGKRSTAWS